MGPDPAQGDMIEAAFTKAYADWDERQRYYQEHPGVPAGWDPASHPNGPPRGLGYSAGVDPVFVFEGPEVSADPAVVSTPEPFDLSAGPALTGSAHWGMVPRPGVGAPGESIVYAGIGDTAAPRRSLLSKLLGRRAR